MFFCFIEINCYSSIRKSVLPRIPFESETGLRKIEQFYFCKSALEAISIPDNVDFIGESAHTDNALQLIDVCAGNGQFSIHNCILTNSITVRYFGRCNEAIIGRCVSVAGKRFESLNAGQDSELTLLDQRCFESCSLKSIVIPASVEVIGKSGFKNATLETLRSESDSHLRPLGSRPFAGCSIKQICFPGSFESLPEHFLDVVTLTC
jgi:hypothetical protein